jgi:hypothetical protein
MFIAAIAGLALGGLALIGSVFGFVLGRQARPQVTVVSAVGVEAPAKAA